MFLTVFFGLPSWELTYPFSKALLKEFLKAMFLFPRWDMLVAGRAYSPEVILFG